MKTEFLIYFKLSLNAQKVNLRRPGWYCLAIFPSQQEGPSSNPQLGSSCVEFTRFYNELVIFPKMYPLQSP